MARGRNKSKTPERVVRLLVDAVKDSSQSALAKNTGLPLYTIQRCLKGEGEPTTATLQKIADYFGVEVDYLRGTGIYRNADLSLEQAQTLVGVMNSAEREYLKFQQIEWRLIHMEDLKDIVAEIQRYIDSVEKLTKVRLKQKKPASSNP